MNQFCAVQQTFAELHGSRLYLVVCNMANIQRSSAPRKPICAILRKGKTGSLFQGFYGNKLDVFHGEGFREKRNIGAWGNKRIDLNDLRCGCSRKAPKRGDPIESDMTFPEHWKRHFGYNYKRGKKGDM